jgi:urease accessory protein
LDSARPTPRGSNPRLTEEPQRALSAPGRRDERPLPVVGRHAQLDLTFHYGNGRTVLAEAYAEPPFRVGGWFAESDGLHVILASSAPGVFGHVRLRQTVRVGSGARVRLTSQAALQIHLSLECATTLIEGSYRVEDGAHLHCDCHPLIPFADARLDQRIEVNIVGDGCLYWTDALMCGREARGERWRFASLAHEIAVSRDGFLEHLERYCIQPTEVELSRAWAASDASYLGTTLLTGWSINPDAAERLHAELGGLPGVRAAADRLEDRMLLVRLLSAFGPAFHEARHRIRDRCAKPSACSARVEVRQTAVTMSEVFEVFLRPT